MAWSFGACTSATPTVTGGLTASAALDYPTSGKTGKYIATLYLTLSSVAGYTQTMGRCQCRVDIGIIAVNTLPQIYRQRS